MKTAIVILVLALASLVPSLLAESATDKELRAQNAAQAETIAALRVQISQTASAQSAQTTRSIQARNQRIETISKVETSLSKIEISNAQLDRLLALDGDLQALLKTNREWDQTREARRTAMQAFQNKNAILAARLQVIIACALVMAFVLLAGTVLRIRSIVCAACDARWEALNG
jgi:chromosome segregation ATPase